MLIGTFLVVRLPLIALGTHHLLPRVALASELLFSGRGLLIFFGVLRVVGVGRVKLFFLLLVKLLFSEKCLNGLIILNFFATLLSRHDRASAVGAGEFAVVLLPLAVHLLHPAAHVPELEVGSGVGADVAVLVDGWPEDDALLENVFDLVSVHIVSKLINNSNNS